MKKNILKSLMVLSLCGLLMLNGSVLYTANACGDDDCGGWLHAENPEDDGSGGLPYSLFDNEGGGGPFNGSKVTKGFVKKTHPHLCPVTKQKSTRWSCQNGTPTQSCPVGAQSVHEPCGQL